MFETLSDRLTGVFDRLRGRGALNEADVREAMREVRIALLEADVNFGVAKDFVATVTEKAVGQAVDRALEGCAIGRLDRLGQPLGEFECDRHQVLVHGAAGWGERQEGFTHVRTVGAPRHELALFQERNRA